MARDTKIGGHATFIRSVNSYRAMKEITQTAEEKKEAKNRTGQYDASPNEPSLSKNCSLDANVQTSIADPDCKSVRRIGSHVIVSSLEAQLWWELGETRMNPRNVALVRGIVRSLVHGERKQGHLVKTKT